MNLKFQKSKLVPDEDDTGLTDKWMIVYEEKNTTPYFSGIKKSQNGSKA